MGFPPLLHEQASKAARRARRRRRAHRLEGAPAQGRLSRHRLLHGLRQLRRRRRRSFRSGKGQDQIHRIVAATDPGYAVNPAQIERQIAGSFVYGLSALFHGGITIKDGRVEQSNFDSYDSLRIKDMPKVESIVMPSGGFWGGVGEPTICVAAPAVLNAFFARPADASATSAQGRRYRLRLAPVKAGKVRRGVDVENDADLVRFDFADILARAQ